MNKLSLEEIVFDQYGRLIPVDGETVFNLESERYYQLSPNNTPLERQVSNMCCTELGTDSVDVSATCDFLDDLAHQIQGSGLAGLLEGPKFPFVLGPVCAGDLGTVATDQVFVKLKDRFESTFPDLHFRVSMQGSIELPQSIKAVTGTGYEKLTKLLEQGHFVVGWIFPDSLKEYAVSSQGKARDRLVSNVKPDSRFEVGLGGLLDIGSALIGTPDMLINASTYPPVLCASGVAHEDDRYVFNYKSYGNHLEFWGMPKTLVAGVEQVSEQWNGVVSIFSVLKLKSQG